MVVLGDACACRIHRTHQNGRFAVICIPGPDVVDGLFSTSWYVHGTGNFARFLERNNYGLCSSRARTIRLTNSQG